MSRYCNAPARCALARRRAAALHMEAVAQASQRELRNFSSFSTTVCAFRINNGAGIRMCSSAQRPSWCFCGRSVAARQRDARWRGGVSSLTGLCIDIHPLPPARIVEFPICLRWGITNHAGIRSRARCFCGGAAGTHQRGARWRGGASRALSASSATLFHLLTMGRVSFLLADFTKCLHLRECMLKSNRHLGDFPTANGKPQTPPGWQRRPSKNGSEGVRIE